MDLSIFSERLSDLILDNGLNTEKLATILSMSRSSVYELLSGKREPTLKTLVSIANYFRCSTDYLTGIELNNHYVQPKPYPPFCKRLPEICSHLGITRYRLMKMSNLSRTSINNWARGTTIPSVSNLIKIALASCLSLDFIIGRE